MTLFSALTSYPSADEANDEKYQEHKEQDLGYSSRSGGDTTKSENTGDDGDYEKYYGPSKHD
ncbi:hypothetical protein GCM10027275_19790 [Rhabdobacter roseus]